MVVCGGENGGECRAPFTSLPDHEFPKPKPSRSFILRHRFAAELAESSFLVRARFPPGNRMKFKLSDNTHSHPRGGCLRGRLHAVCVDIVIHRTGRLYAKESILDSFCKDAPLRVRQLPLKGCTEFRASKKLCRKLV
ncbi:hypothetical protein ZHAS_00019041 [Anopheles sinensis]|uniref:Uncharacterized protein n=1 Tax=Anopheles sinensis TaxID=74873 RepID=A0A084WLA2_ANOSI|nr:hypothetical protein ZHAS_00019041 [Anopheles sinensis]